MRKTHSRGAAQRREYAPIFAALGDETRLYLVSELTKRGPRSISDLTEGTTLTRQAVTKHLRVLEGTGIVENIRSGRESLFELNAKPLMEMREYLDIVARQWDDALLRLKDFVE